MVQVRADAAGGLLHARRRVGPRPRHARDAARLRENVLFRKGEHVKAIREYNAAVKLDPNNALAYSNRALAFLLWDTGKEVRALKDAEMVIKLQPTWTKVRRQRCVCMVRVAVVVEA